MMFCSKVWTFMTGQPTKMGRHASLCASGSKKTMRHEACVSVPQWNHRQARREPQRGPGKHYRGALSHHILYVLRSRRRRRREGRKRGERCPLTIRLGVRGSVVKMDFMHILGHKEAIWNTIFSIFERRLGPPNVAGPRKTPPFPPPLSTGLITGYVIIFWGIMLTMFHDGHMDIQTDKPDKV